MNLFGLMDISGGAMRAERMRAEVVAANMANAETTRTPEGGPYRRQHVVFAAGGGDGRFLDSMTSAVLQPATTAVLQSFKRPGTAAPGVRVAAVISDPVSQLKRYDPGHPDADPDGFVSYPDINPLTEMVDLMGATRAYGLNGSAVQAEKGMIAAALEIAKS